ncbi:antibiotic biosynthesis monooxygenase [Mesocricetibacter intestinalis]|uniref:Antibiotic biosynthesis monooxygenase n=2 Tax=Mesocricetibacter intestinalis TaxID=1521930 RepID=A0A4R6VBC5_9PAST|nr:antibiotic biosynthesis monooxygenase [Mesocricetibacter intestinalis]TDQ57441.1 antibiotic biosynthesis monooxygenase [Mesocricetibacter intestinalis]
MYAATLQDEPAQWYFFEIYQDDAAYQKHRQSEHFQYYLQQTANMLRDKKIINIDPLFLRNQGGLYFD